MFDGNESVFLVAPGRDPLGARLLLERGDRGLDRGEEVRWIDRPGQLVPVDLSAHRVLHLGEDEVDIARIEFLVDVTRACRRRWCPRR